MKAQPTLMNFIKRSHITGLAFFAACMPAIATENAGPQSADAIAVAAPESTDVQVMMQRYYDGAYRELAQQGPDLLQAHSNNHDLRFAVANSLAWTGAHQQAIAQYELLHGTPFEDRALLGAGHVQRWHGRPDRAAHAYRRVLERDAGNTDARDGLQLAEREINPRTTIRIGHARNSDDATRTWTSLSHDWRNEAGNVLYSVTAGYADEDKNGLSASQRDLAFSIDAPDAPLSPQFEISGQESPTNKIFGSLTVKLDDLPLYLTAAKINWGKSAFDIRALNDGLTAEQLGIRTNLRTSWGALRGSYNHYSVSDNNVIRAANLHFTPALQPFPTRTLKLFTGLEAREARFYDPRYWTPVDGYYSAFAGLLAEWSSHNWDSYGYVQYGVPIGGESGNNWSTGFALQYWLSEKWVAGIDFWAMHTPRDGGYRSTSGILRIGRVW